MRKNTINNLKITAIIFLVVVTIAIICFVITRPPEIRPEQMSDFKQWLFNR